MGLFGFLKKDDRSKVEKLRDKAAKKIGNMYYQTADRVAAIDQMAELAAGGDEKAVRVLLSRFESLAPKTTEDRDEKQYVHDLLVDLGDKAEPVVRKYVRTTATPVYWAMQVLQHRLSSKDYIAFLTEVLDDMEPDYVRDPEKKIGLVQMAAEFNDEALGQSMVRFIEDHHENVRFYAIEGVAKHGYAFGIEPMLNQLEEEESVRIMTKILEVFAEHGWDIGEHADRIKPKLQDGFALKGGKVVKG